MDGNRCSACPDFVPKHRNDVRGCDFHIHFTRGTQTLRKNPEDGFLSHCMSHFAFLLFGYGVITLCLDVFFTHSSIPPLVHFLLLVILRISFQSYLCLE